MGSSVGVLIVDDSVVARAVIARIVEASARFAVAGSVGTVAAALDFLAHEKVGIILLDIAMPGTDGITGLPGLLAAGRGARVVVVSSTAVDGTAATIRALALGAADTLVKPATGALSGRFAQMLVERMDRLCDRHGRIADGDPPIGPDVGRTVADVPAVRPAGRTAGGAGEYDIVAIGASTGGIHALGQLLRELPSDFRLPILVTQHLPPSFMPYFASQLAVLADRPCEVAGDRVRIRPGQVIVAPGDAHLRCVSLGARDAAVRLSREPVASGCLPSVDPMFASLAEVYGSRVMAIVLSGMGCDGAKGTARVRAAGGCVVVQDQASSVVWGMPGTVARLGLADAVLPPDAIGRLVGSGQRP